MIPRTKKIISVLLVSIFLLSIFSIPLIALAQQQGAGQLAPLAPPSADEGKGFFARIWGAIVETFIGISSGIILFAAGIIGKLIGFFFSWLIYFFAWILDTAISGFNITNAKIVQIGWAATRDLANMAFILALIIIAISTILRIKAFAAQQMLWRVIVAALLVNFSLVFGGVIIDASQMLAKFFVNAATGNNPGEFSIRLANAMDITAFYNPGTGSFSATIFKSVNQIWVAPAGIILGLVALVIMTFVFGAAAFFMLVRVIWLWILLIFAPFAWAALAFPGQNKYFSEWWHKLFHWAFFAPVFTFFMWLSLHLFQENGRLAKGVFSSVVPALGNKAIATVEASAPEAIMQFGLMTGLMVASLIVAKKFGVYGAQGSLNMLTKWGESAKNFAGRMKDRGIVAATKPLKPGEVAPLWRRAGAAIGGVALATPGLRGAYAGMAQRVSKDYDDAYKQYKDADPTIRRQILKSRMLDPKARLAIEQSLSEDGELKYDTAQREAMFQRAMGYGKEKNFQEFFPVTAAKALGKSLEEITRKIKKAADIYVEELEEAVPHLSPKQLRDVGSSSDEKRNIAHSAITNRYRALPITEQREISRILGIKDKKVREEETVGLPPELRKILSQRAITLSPRWELDI